MWTRPIPPGDVDERSTPSIRSRPGGHDVEYQRSVLHPPEVERSPIRFPRKPICKPSSRFWPLACSAGEPERARFFE